MQSLILISISVAAYVTIENEKKFLVFAQVENFILRLTSYGKTHGFL